MPVPTCCKLHAHNFTCIQIFLGRRGTPDPTGQLVLYMILNKKPLSRTIKKPESVDEKRVKYFCNVLE